MRGFYAVGILGCVAFVLTCVGQDNAAPPSQVTRSEILRTAESYLNHQWIASSSNAFHGVDSDGIQMDTPEEGFASAEGDTGWWKIGATNRSIPYMWGGFDTPESFDQGLREGKAAGDMYSSEKRRLLDDAVSKHAVGIDCSGFVSRCLNLPRSFSTRELAALCDPVTDLSDLRPGDVFNRHNAHVVIFLEWVKPERATPPVTSSDNGVPGEGAAAGKADAITVNAAKSSEKVPGTQIHVYEAGGEGGSKVLLSTLTLKDLLDRGFQAYRYRGIREE